ncbi:beta-N-acetylhexosaminidase [Paenibacillus pinistramenti]|uniref:beta-N-acetylhexosaminidase n=1 Tax=Paenibacillus pinistramenti TaxID=1768003 RepID=UPI00110840D2|nr:beta-N-acetylhexosaminidase [Paenibacillus pinistramenti]
MKRSIVKSHSKVCGLIAVLAFCLTAAGCANSDESASSASQAPPASSSAASAPSSSAGSAPVNSASSSAAGAASPAPASEAPLTPASADPVQDMLDRMTLDEKLGQLVIVGLDGTSLQTETRKMIEAYKVGGFILYKPNITSAGQTLQLLNQLKTANSSNPAALWLSTDQEGGRVSRMPESYLKIPKAAEIGKEDSPSYSRSAGQAIGEQLKSLGFNLDFAPVMDINSNPDNPVIGDRSYGADAETVIRSGLAVLKGLQSEGIAGVVKHFPGHGDTSVDSHLELPVVDKTLEQLQAFELKPFKSAAEQGTDMIMVGHLLVPGIDPDHPASLSEKMVSGLLRGTLGYEGVVITDDLTMGGIVKHYPIGQAAVQAILAGSDIVLVGHDTARETEVITSLKEAAVKGTLSADAIDKHVCRILKLKQKYSLSDKPLSAVSVNTVNAKVKKLLEH